MSASIALDLLKGHLNWSMTDLSRQSGVSRTLIYYYFGKSKEDIFRQSIEYFTSEIFDTRPEVARKLAEGDIINMIKTTRKNLREHPHLVVIYSNYRLKQSELGKAFFKAEKKYLEMLETSLPTKWKPFTRNIFAFILGLTLLPVLSEDDFIQAEKFLKRFWK